MHCKQRALPLGQADSPSAFPQASAHRRRADAPGVPPNCRAGAKRTASSAAMRQIGCRCPAAFAARRRGTALPPALPEEPPAPAAASTIRPRCPPPQFDAPARKGNCPTAASAALPKRASPAPAPPRRAADRCSAALFPCAPNVRAASAAPEAQSAALPAPLTAASAYFDAGHAEASAPASAPAAA